MLKKSSNLFALGLASIVLFMSSCSIMNNEFSKQRYTKFKVHHDQNTLSVNSGHDTNQQNSISSTENVPVSTEIKQTNSEIVRTENTTAVKQTKTNAPVYHALNKNSKNDKVNSIQLTNLNLSHKEMKKIGKILNKPNNNAILLVILCLILPPVAVLLERGVAMEFWIDLLLCLLFFLPGVIYAFYVCFSAGGGGGRGETRR